MQSSRKRFSHLSIFFVCGVIDANAAEPIKSLEARPISPVTREQFQLAEFYQQHVNVNGLPIVGSAKVLPAALAECGWVVSHMLEHRPEILKALAAARVRFAIMAATEYTTDVPEHAHLKPRVYWDRRARGLGATPSAPAVSGGEENLLAYPGDPYPRENISIHEFAHAIHEVAMKTIDPTFDRRLQETFDAAISTGLWKNTYAAVNRQEYWAEGTQAWFDNNDANNALHNDISTRAKLETYDPALAALCTEVFGDRPWRYLKPADRKPEDRAHLVGYDPTKAPRFRWRQEAIPKRPRVALDCADGTIEFELSGSQDEMGRLLAEIQEGYYSGGNATFHDDSFQLSPAEKTPDGSKVPENAGRWKVMLGDGSPQILGAKVLKGAGVIARTISDSRKSSIRVQRIVRLN